MGEDAGGDGGEGVGGGGEEVGGGGPAHDAEAADEVEVDGREAEEAEVGEVDPVAAVLVGGEVHARETRLGGQMHGDWLGEADKGGAGGAEDVTIGGGLGDEEAGVGVGREVLGVHGHVADEEERAAGGIERERHERAEGKAGVFAREGGERAGGGGGEEGAGALGVGGLGGLRSGGAGAGVLAGFGRWHETVLW